ncbi:MAG TPA: NUDIX domain-containing protein [archaeon]|nr:NUDIX domain-containing protein [archaeon]
MILHDTTSIVAEKERKILLIKRGNPPFRGYWALPGGHVEKGEAIAKAAQREAKEEVSGVKITKKAFSFVHDSRIGHRHRCHVFFGKVVGKIYAGSDAVDAKFFSLEQMKKMNVTAYSIYILNRIYEKEL